MTREHSDPQNKTRDRDPFACSVRGLDEEIGIRVDVGQALLLGIGIDSSTFVAYCEILVGCNETYEEVINSWKRAPTGGEIEAMDCLPASVKDISDAINKPLYEPSLMVRSQLGSGNANLVAEW